MSCLSWASRFTGVLIGILIFVFGWRESTLGRQKTSTERRQADLKIASAQVEAAEAYRKAEESRVKQVEIEQQNIVLRTDLTNAQRVLLEVQSRIKPRQITGGQREEFLSLLKDVPPGIARVWYAKQDGESRAFAEQMVTALEELHWTVYGHEPVPQDRGVPHETEDLVFDVPPNGPVPVCLQPLRDALSQIGFSSGTRDLGSTDGAVDLFVGTKRLKE